MADNKKKVFYNTSEWLSHLLSDERAGGVYRLVRESEINFTLYRVARDVVKICDISLANVVAGDALIHVWAHLEHAGAFDILHLEGGDVKLVP